MTHDKTQTNPYHTQPNDDLQTPSIIPQDEEYYTLDMDRLSEPNDEELAQIEKMDMTTDVNDFLEPTKSSSIYDGDIVKTDTEYHPLSSNQGGDTDEKHINDQNTISAEVGDPGHWGIDENTG